MNTDSHIEYSFKKCVELDMIDCNCNDCVFMERDLITYQKWHDWHKDMAQREYWNFKGKTILEAWELVDNAQTDNERSNAKGMLRVAFKIKFQFEKKYLVSYGKCKKYGKDVSFLPNVCQLETQHCFEHRIK